MVVYRIINKPGDNKDQNGGENSPGIQEAIPVLEPWRQAPTKEQEEDLNMEEIHFLNRLAPEGDEKQPPPAPKWFYGLIAALLVLTFSFLIWGDIFVSLANPLPDLGFLSRSSQLAKEPALAALKPAVVSIELPASRGSGFNISPEGTIITNRHVVENKGSIGVVFPSGRRYKGKSWQGIEGFDLAVVEIAGKDLPHLPFGSQLPQIGEEIVFIGNPLGFDWTVSQGRVKSYISLEGYATPLILLEGPVFSGSSGSPVFNSKGEVVAVIFATLKGEENSGLAIPIENLKDIIGQPSF